MSELKGYIEATKIEPKLEDITITPSKQEQNFKSKVDGYDKIRVNAIPCETLNVTPKKEKQVIEGMYDKVNVDGISAEILNITPKKESQYFDGIYEKIYVDEIERDNLTVTPSMAEQSFNGLYENVFVEKITGDTLHITPKEEQQAFNGLYENVNVDAIQTEEVTIVPDFSTQDTFEVTATEGKLIKKATVNKDANLVPENILEGANIYGVDGTFKPLDTSDATATAEDIAKDKTAYVNGEKVTGNMLAFDTSQMRQCQSMFLGNTTMTEFGGLDTSTIVNMSNMFKGCTALKKVTFSNTSNVTGMGMMFEGCTALEEIVDLDMSKVSSTNRMFYGCTSLKSITGLNTSKITANGSIGMMFSGCTNLIDLPVLDFSGLIASLGKELFSGCYSLSDESLNNILASCIGATQVTVNKNLAYIGISSTQATRCQSLSNYQAFLDAGWVTGY